MQLLKKTRAILVVLFVLGLSPFMKAQGNLPYVDYKTFHFGFSLGVNALHFGVTNSELQDTYSGNTYHAAVSALQPGFSVGVITDMRLSRYLNLRFNPTLHFGDRQLSYTYTNGATEINSVPSIPMCFPLYLKYSSERKGNYRPYLLWGVGTSVDLGRAKDNPVFLKPLDFYTEFGVGCDLYFSFFKLAPELKFAIGLNNLITPLEQRTSDIDEKDKKFTTAISKLTSRMLTLTFNFE